MICKKEKCNLYLECLHNHNQYYRMNIIKKLGPLLLDKKPIHLFCFKNDFRFKSEVIELVKKHFSDLQFIKYRIIPSTNDTVKLLFYNVKNVKAILTNRNKMNFLKSRGYSSEMTYLDYIDYLESELKINHIPPEIGIFFGYPIKDVLGYIGHPSLKRTAIKGWEFYGDPRKSEKIYKGFYNAEVKILQYLLMNSFGLKAFIKKIDLKLV